MDIYSSSTKSIMHHVNTDNNTSGSLDDCLVEFALDQWKPSYKHYHDLSGWLNKRGKGRQLFSNVILIKGGYLKKWQSRWLVLKGGSLYYFRKNTDALPAGVLFVDGNSIVEDKSVEEGVDFCIALTVDSSCSLDSRKSYQRRTYFFQAYDYASFDYWMKALTSHCSAQSPSGELQLSGSQKYQNRERRRSTIVGRLGARMSTTSTIASSAESYSSSTMQQPSIRTSTNITGDIILETNSFFDEQQQQMNSSNNKTLYSVLMATRKQISQFSESLTTQLNTEKDNCLLEATQVIRQVRQLLYFVDGRFNKSIQNPDLSGCISRQLSYVIDRIRQLGFHARRLSEEGTAETKSQVLFDLEELSNGLHVLINMGKNISDIQLALVNNKMIRGIDRSIQVRIQELTQLSIDVANQILNHSLEQSAILKRSMDTVLSFVKSVEGISQMVFSDSNTRDLDDVNLQFENQQNRLVLDQREFSESQWRLASICKALLTASEQQKAIVSSTREAEDLQISQSLEAFFASSAFLLRYLTTLGIIERRYRGKVDENDARVKGLKLICTLLSQLTLLPPPENATDFFIEQDHVIKSFTAALGESLPPLEDGHSEVIEVVRDASTGRALVELVKIVLENAQLLRGSLNLTGNDDQNDFVSAYSLPLITAANQIAEELLTIPVIDEKLLIQRSILNEALEEFQSAQHNWHTQVNYSWARSQLLRSMERLESTCMSIREILKQSQMTAKRKSTPSFRRLDAIREEIGHKCDIVEDDDDQIDKILEEDHLQFATDPDLIFRAEDSTQVKGGTLEKLVENLTYYRLPSSTFTSAFLLTYRSFTSARELLQLLIRRYNIEPPQELGERLRSLYFSRKIIPIRLRVFNVLKMWIRNNFEDFETDPELMRTLQDFLPTMRADFHKGTTDFQQLLEKKQSKRTESSGSDDSNIVCSNSLCAIPSFNDMPTVPSIDSLELAKQLTVMQWEIFTRIQPNEFLNQSWNRKELHAKSPNVRQMIQFSNFIIEWISAEIISCASLKHRAQLIKHFITIGDKLRSLNNFEGLKCVLCGLQASGIRRLHKSWDLLPAKHRLIFEDLAELMSEEKSRKNYRHHLHTINPPCIPFIGVYLTDLTMIETGNPDYLVEYPHLINFHKRFLIAQVIQEFKQYQGTPYSTLSRIDYIIDWIKSRPTLSAEQVYEQSLVLEPRVAKRISFNDDSTKSGSSM